MRHSPDRRAPHLEQQLCSRLLASPNGHVQGRRRAVVWVDPVGIGTGAQLAEKACDIANRRVWMQQRRQVTLARSARL